MALAKQCDAKGCGKFFKPSTDENTPNGITFSYFDQQSNVQNTIEKKELCPDCLKKVRDMLNG